MIRLHIHVVMSLAVLVLGFSPAAVQGPPVPDAADPVARPDNPSDTRSAGDNSADAASMVYVPAVFHNYDPGYANPFGVIMYAGVNDTQGLARMRAAGSRWATTMLFWSATEPNPPVASVHTYDWSLFDTAAHNAQAAGIDLFVLFTGNPAWAAQYPGGPVTDTAHLVNFVTVMAERYDGDGAADAVGNPVVNHWSFYAEPDNGEEARAPGGKGFWGNNSLGYAAMLSQVAPAIHAANPNAKVLTGGLAYDWFTTEGGPFVESFLAGVLQNLNTNHGGVAPYLDAVAFHYYPINTVRWPTLREKALEIQGIMNAHGAGALPLIVPEMGFWSDEAHGSSETIQAQTLVRMYVYGLSVGVEHMSWYTIFDFAPETMGLFRNGDLAQPRPSYTAYSTMTSELTGYYYQQALTAPGVEGYVFRLPNGRTKTVLWATSAPANVAFVQSCARRVDLLGTATQITDGGAGDVDGAVNGSVTLTAAVNHPIYVGPCQ